MFSVTKINLKSFANKNSMYFLTEEEANNIVKFSKKSPTKLTASLSVGSYWQGYERDFISNWVKRSIPKNLNINLFTACNYSCHNCVQPKETLPTVESLQKRAKIVNKLVKELFKINNNLSTSVLGGELSMLKLPELVSTLKTVYDGVPGHEVWYISNLFRDADYYIQLARQAVQDLGFKKLCISVSIHDATVGTKGISTLISKMLKLSTVTEVTTSMSLDSANQRLAGQVKLAIPYMPFTPRPLSIQAGGGKFFYDLTKGFYHKAYYCTFSVLEDGTVNCSDSKVAAAEGFEHIFCHDTYKDFYCCSGVVNTSISFTNDYLQVTDCECSRANSNERLVYNKHVDDADVDEIVQFIMSTVVKPKHCSAEHKPANCMAHANCVLLTKQDLLNLGLEAIGAY